MRNHNFPLQQLISDVYLRSHCEWVKCSASLTPSCSSLPVPWPSGYSFCLVLHIDMLLTRGILLSAWVLQNSPLPDSVSPEEIRKVRIVYQRFAGTSSSDLHQLAQSSSDACWHQSPLILPIDIKEAWTQYFLKMDLRMRSSIFLVGVFSINKSYFTPPSLTFSVLVFQSVGHMDFGRVTFWVFWLYTWSNTFILPL